jgi:hypothetical protein
VAGVGDGVGLADAAWADAGDALAGLTEEAVAATGDPVAAVAAAAGGADAPGWPEAGTSLGFGTTVIWAEYIPMAQL